MTELEALDAAGVLRWTYRTHKRVVLVSSFQAEASVLIDLACGIVAEPEVLTLDTGRLPIETFEVMDEIQARYPIRLRVLRPDPTEVAEMTLEHGRDLFRKSVDLRLQCCGTRKVRPLDRALPEYDAWITGLRRHEAETRRATPIAEPDPARPGLTKIAPLATWTRDDVWAYIRTNGVPYNRLHDRGYASIGCAPCSRAILPGEPERAGRWWWERNGVKECGLHPIPLEVA